MLWIDQREPSDSPCGFWQRPAGRTPLPGRANFGIAEFRNPICYRANLLDQARILPRAVRQVRSNKRARGRHEIARPLRRERENSSAGSKASRTAQIVRLGRTGHYKGYVHAKAQATSASSTLCPRERTWRRSAHTRRTRLQDARPVAEVPMSRGPHQHGARDRKIIVVP